jgi:hypothetical protein
VPGDYEGTGVWTAAIYRRSTGLWSIRGLTAFYYGDYDHPVPADYDGDGRDDAGIFRDNTSLWGIRDITRIYYGAIYDYPVTR